MNTNEELKARIAELEAQTPSALKQKLRSAESRIAELEAQQAVLVDALEDYVVNDTAPVELNTILQKAIAALAAVKGD